MTSTTRRVRVTVLAMLLLAAACGGTTTDGVSSLDIGRDLFHGLDAADASPGDGPDKEVVDATGEAGEDAARDAIDDAFDDAVEDAVGDAAVDTIDATGDGGLDTDAADLPHDVVGTTCLDGCPDGWQCREVPDSCPDCVFVCVDAYRHLCEPCSTTDDCRYPEGVDAACLDFGGAAGHFCGGACEGADETCPAGYHCADAAASDGASARQCLPDDGACACSPHAIDLALTTPCSVTNASGTCTGTRACTVNGLTACDATTPGPETCNGLDDDCNGATDDGLVPTPTTCGVGACAAEGSLTCADGQAIEACTPGSPAADDATCDAEDDDCDGSTDEDFVGVSVACGVGACLAQGTTTCVDGHESDSCRPADGSGLDDSCNGLDDDCDGQTDEDYAPTATACGVGACVGEGLKACLDGVEVDSCLPGQPAPDDASCDGLDDDCNGQTDEDYVPSETACGAGACAAAGETICAAGVETDGCQPGLPAPGDASCDGLDDDCDGQTDEDYAGRVVTCGLGACLAEGTTICAAGVETDSCQPLGVAGQDNVCNGLDDDCDGQTDEDVVATATHCGVGACRAVGETVCLLGLVFDTCTPGVPAATDATCNGADDDCNGQTDDQYVAPATTCGVGVCRQAGVVACVAGVPTDSCQPGQPAADDATCNGLDDDCNGQTDDGYAPRPVACGIGACQAAGTTVCENGAEQDTCTPAGGSASDTVCNGVDDDCDGATDEDFVQSSTDCGVGACATVGHTSCVLGTVHDTCTPTAPAATDATCDGLDDDCSGQADEDYLVTDTTCGVGACAATGKTSCAAGLVTDSCQAGVPAIDDAVCDGADGDCDGQTDEDYVAVATTCGVGACAASGTKTCVGGHVVDSCTPGAPGLEVCNGVDDDCNGKTDAADGNALLANDQPLCEKQKGVCLASKKSLAFCVAGAWKPCNDAIYSFWAPAYEPIEGPACDGLDNDCDAATDEGYVPSPTTCGVGACAATGQKTCVGGHVVDSCTPGIPAVSDTTCDGVDDDCDGSADDDFGIQVTFCGVGACRATGTITCASGAQVVTCTAGTPAADDTTCDGVDDDCNDLTDDGYVPSTTACGLGACAATGDKTCANGVETDSCTPGTPQPEACNAIDDNCNGQVDEGQNNAGCTAYYRDVDTDGYGDPNASRCLCKPDPAGKYVLTDKRDCCDTDAAAHPAPPQPPWSTTARTCGGFDFDCTGAEEKQFPNAGYCKCSDWTCISCSFAEGWEYGPPACGVASNWVSECKNGLFSCTTVRAPRTQGCR